MRMVLDTHTHTLASGHAYNTINEMALAARKKRMKLLCITEHAPRMPGSCHSLYFVNLKVVKRFKYGVELLLGAETNIMDYEGTLDLKPSALKKLDVCIASLHTPCVEPGTVKENTNAYMEAMKNPYVHILGHPDDGRYPVDYERIVKAAKKYHVALEINNHSLAPDSFRRNSETNVIKLAKLCKKWNVPVTIASDAHTDDDVGVFTYALRILKKVDFPSELILNRSVEVFKKHIDLKKTS